MAILYGTPSLTVYPSGQAREDPEGDEDLQDGGRSVHIPRLPLVHGPFSPIANRGIKAQHTGLMGASMASTAAPPRPASSR